MPKITGSGERVAARMRALGYWKNNQPEVGRFSEENGFLPSYVYRWLAGETPRGERLFRLAEALGIDAKALVTARSNGHGRRTKSLLALVAFTLGLGTATASVANEVHTLPVTKTGAATSYRKWFAHLFHSLLGNLKTGAQRAGQVYNPLAKTALYA